MTNPRPGRPVEKGRKLERQSMREHIRRRAATEERAIEALRVSSARMNRGERLAEIAASLGMSYSALVTLRSRARAYLRQRKGGQDETQ